jgi:hypothetical protein
MSKKKDNVKNGGVIDWFTRDSTAPKFYEYLVCMHTSNKLMRTINKVVAAALKQRKKLQRKDHELFLKLV